MTPSLLGLTGAGVLWDGKNVTSANTPAKAFSLAGASTASVVFTFYDPAATVRNASLTLVYLGVVLTTAKAQPTATVPGEFSAKINWSFGQITKALEGVFQLKASLLYGNGTTAWSEGFFVFVKAPYFVESAAAVVLLILVIAELYWGISAVREARRTKPPAGGGVAPWSPGSPSSPGTSPPADSSSTPPAPPNPPASGAGGTP